jgi:CBS domain-containing protein
MGLKENLQNEPVSRLALREPVVANAKATVREGILRMRERGLGCVIIADDDHRPLGIFTEGMLRRMLVSNPAAVEEPLGEHMNRAARWVRLTDPVIKVVQAMQNEKTRFVGVIDDEGRLAGLTGQKGLMEFVAEHFPQQVMVQRIGRPAYFAQREGA